jgi:hypothetical protein
MLTLNKYIFDIARVSGASDTPIYLFRLFHLRRIWGPHGCKYNQYYILKNDAILSGRSYIFSCGVLRLSPEVTTWPILPVWDGRRENNVLAEEIARNMPQCHFVHYKAIWTVLGMNPFLQRKTNHLSHVGALVEALRWFGGTLQVQIHYRQKAEQGSLLEVFFDPEDRNSMFFRNFGECLPGYTASYLFSSVIVVGLVTGCSLVTMSFVLKLCFVNIGCLMAGEVSRILEYDTVKFDKKECQHVWVLYLSSLNAKGEIALCHEGREGARGSVVRWGTMVQAGRSQVRFPLRSLNFSIDFILPTSLCPCGRLSL